MVATEQNAREYVDSLFKKHKIVGISMTNCPEAQRAKVALETFHIKKDDFCWLEIDKREDTEEIKKYVELLTGAKTIPQVFINGKLYGGGDDVVAGCNGGRMEEFLKAEHII